MSNSNKKIYNEYMKKYMLKRYKERRKLALSLLGGKCIKCGSTENLEFDHIKASSKKFTIAKGWSCSEKDFLNEIKKCQLLCIHCHLIKGLESFDFTRNR